MLACVLVTGCTSVAGAGIALGITGAAVLAAKCYDHVQIKVLDGMTGGPTCDAVVSVSDGDDEEEVLPCFHTRLSEGTYTLRATARGYAPAVSQIVVRRMGSCEHAVQSVELTLVPAGMPIVPLSPRPAAALPSAPPPPPVKTPADEQPIQPSSEPETPPAAPAPPGSSPVQRFPDTPPPDGGR